MRRSRRLLSGRKVVYLGSMDRLGSGFRMHMDCRDGLMTWIWLTVLSYVDPVDVKSLCSFVPNILGLFFMVGLHTLEYHAAQSSTRYYAQLSLRIYALQHDLSNAAHKT